MSINLANTSSEKISIPPYYSDVGTLRVKKQKIEKADGEDRIVLETEILAPKEATVDGVNYKLAGQELKFYLSLSDSRTGKATMSPLAQLKEFHEKMGLPLEFDNDSLPYEGLIFDFMLQSNERVLQRRVRDSEGRFSYEPVLDALGKPRKLGWQWNSFISGAIGPSALSVDEGF